MDRFVWISQEEFVLIWIICGTRRRPLAVLIYSHLLPEAALKGPLAGLHRVLAFRVYVIDENGLISIRLSARVQGLLSHHKILLHINLQSWSLSACG